MGDMSGYYPPQQPPPPLQQPPHDIYSHYSPRFSYFEPPRHPPQPPLPLHHHTPQSPPSRPDHDSEVRTLFIAGLPANVKNREIYHLFREFPGFISTNLRPPSGNSQAFAFAVFANQQSAVAAMHAFNGMVFDLEEGSTLYIDLAKSNSRSKRQRTGNERSGSGKKQKASRAFPKDGYESGVGSLHIPGMDNSHYNIVGYPSAQSHMSFDSGGMVDANVAQSSKSISSSIPQDKSPCPTIFVANLDPKCSEQGLQKIFSRCRGFLKLKLQRARGAPVAFVDFEDIACSTEALTQLQGTILHSSPAGEGMHLEYAKSRMGKRRRA
ncbi:uncharacterized protein LOC141642471 isoform X2 [Silene latifolia]|uniref:uncharacterized protein LOC141642471 isoform X2 n=1 Tax=Silene latifolia TaxID=37657 RepID=UPI003D775726